MTTKKVHEILANIFKFFRTSHLKPVHYLSDIYRYTTHPPPDTGLVVCCSITGEYFRRGLGQTKNIESISMKLLCRLVGTEFFVSCWYLHALNECLDYHDTVKTIALLLRKVLRFVMSQKE